MNPFKVRKSRNFPELKSPVYEVPKKKGVRKMIERLRMIERQLGEVRPLYNERDQLLLALVNVRGGLEKHGLKIVDMFEDKNTRFKVAAISRYEAKWVMQ